MLDGYRDTADPYLRSLARLFARTEPDTVTWLAFLTAVAAGVLWAATAWTDPTGRTGIALFFAGGLCVALSGILDALDGHMARSRGSSSARGDFLDHVLDRYADVAIVGGLTIGAYGTSDLWGVLAVLGVLLASYAGTQAQAVGVGRNYRGMLGRADRLLLLSLAALAQLMLVLVARRASILATPLALPAVPPALAIVSPTLMDLLLVFFAVAGQATAIQRARATWKELSPRRLRGEAAVAQAQAAVDSARSKLSRAKTALAEVTAAEQATRSIRQAAARTGRRGGGERRRGPREPAPADGAEAVTAPERTEGRPAAVKVRHQ